MKVYEKIVFDYDFNIIEEVSYEYDGEVALCDGGGGDGQMDNDAQAASFGAGDFGGISGMGGVATGFSSDGSVGYGGGLSAADLASSGYDAEVNSRNYSTNTGWGYNPNASSFSLSQFVKDTGKYGSLATSATGNIALGMTVGAAKASANQWDSMSNAFASSPPSSFGSIASTSTGSISNTSQSVGSMAEGLPDNYVWDGKSFVSPTSPTGQQAIAQAQSQGTTGVTNMSNLSLEDQLKQEQLNILRKQSSESDALTKLIYQAAGIVKDSASGEWRNATEEEKISFMNPAQRQEYEIYKQTLDRQQKALNGELPISPALEKEITDWNAQNQESLTRRLGTGFMASTPGIQSQENQNIRTGLLREEARRGQIASGQSQITSWQNSQANQQANQYNALMGIPSRTSGLLTGYSNALVPYTQANQLSYYANRDSQILADAQSQRKYQQEKDQNKTTWEGIAKLGGFLFN